MSSISALKEYAQVGLETEVPTADPRRLIVMLYEGAIAAVAQGRCYMANGQIGPKGEKISKAITIIEGLRASLDVQAGGQIAEQLGGLYEYMVNRLLASNMKNDQVGLEEVGRLLTELKGAWEAIAGEVQGA